MTIVVNNFSENAAFPILFLFLKRTIDLFQQKTKYIYIYYFFAIRLTFKAKQKKCLVSLCENNSRSKKKLSIKTTDLSD